MTTTTLDTAMSGPPPVATRHDHQGVIVTSIERPGPEVVAACGSLYTGLVLNHLGKHGGMEPEMKPVWGGAVLCGPAVTCLGADWRIRSMAADLAEPPQRAPGSRIAPPEIRTERRPRPLRARRPSMR